MPKVSTPQSPCLLFLPVSGHEGSGELFRCLSIARAALARWPDARIHFGLSRASRFLDQVPHDTHLLDGSPTHATAQVNRLLARVQPHVVIYDSAGRVAQLATARRLGLRTVYVSSRPNARRAGFRLRRMRWLDQHWSAEAPFLGGALSRLERLKLTLVPRLVYVPVGVMFDPPDAEVAARLRRDLGLGDGAYAVFCPGGGGRFEHAPETPAFFGSAAAEFARATGARTVAVGVLAGSAPSGADAVPIGPDAVPIDPGRGVVRLDSLPNAELMALLQGADMAAVNGGSLLLQALALGVAAVAVPIAGDQPARIAACAERGAVTPATLEPAELASAAIDLYRDRPRQSAQRAAIAALGLDNGLPRAMEALSTLL